jgi:hypothetical protein
MRELVRWLWRASVGPASLGARRRAIYCVAARASASGREKRRRNYDILATAREQKRSRPPQAIIANSNDRENCEMRYFTIKKYSVRGSIYRFSRPPARRLGFFVGPKRN